MHSVTLTQARANLAAVLDRVARGEEITITRHGRPAAVVLRPDAVRSRRAESVLSRAGELATMLDAAHEKPLSPAAVSAEHADQWTAGVDADRERG